ncbi:MAG: hypothetical protein ACWGNK_00710 [Desulfobacterales bacterium]
MNREDDNQHLSDPVDAIKACLLIGKNEAHHHNDRGHGEERSEMEWNIADPVIAIYQVDEQKHAAGPDKDIRPTAIESKKKEKNADQRENNPVG